MKVNPVAILVLVGNVNPILFALLAVAVIVTENVFNFLTTQYRNAFLSLANGPVTVTTATVSIRCGFHTY
jgi:hypothetical protein